MPDPVFYCDGKQYADPLYPGLMVEGKIPEGWYFANETWSDQYGPFDTEAVAREQLASYCKTLGV